MATKAVIKDEIQCDLDSLHFWQDEYRNHPSAAHFAVCVSALERLTKTLQKHVPASDSRISVLERQLQHARHELSRMARLAQSAPSAVGQSDTDEQ